jgi:hypothetical protein
LDVGDRDAGLRIEIRQAEFHDVFRYAQPLRGDRNHLGRRRSVGAIAIGIDESGIPGLLGFAECGEKMLHRVRPIIGVLRRGIGAIALRLTELVAEPAEQMCRVLVDECEGVARTQQRTIRLPAGDCRGDIGIGLQRQHALIFEIDIVFLQHEIERVMQRSTGLGDRDRMTL